MHAKHQTATWVKLPSFSVKAVQIDEHDSPRSEAGRFRSPTKCLGVLRGVIYKVEIDLWNMDSNRFQPNHCESRWLGVGRLVVFQHAATTAAIAGCETYEDKIGHWKPFNRHILTLGIHQDPSTTLFGDIWKGFIRIHPFLEGFWKASRISTATY